MASQNRLSRHDFLKLSGTACLGMVLSSCSVPRPLTTTSTRTNTPPLTTAETAAPHRKEVSIPDTEQWTLSSSAIGQEYNIFVALPHAYTIAIQAYPVIYVLDANAYFGIVTETVRSLNLFDDIPEIIVVGIGYPVDNFIATLGFRTRDLTPTEDLGWYDRELKPYFTAAPEDAGSGGAAQFLQFIRKELIPLIDQNYRTVPGYNCLMGHSLGGLFDLYALFNQSDTFQRYIIGSPSIWWDNATILDTAKEFAANKADVSARVFISAGADEDPDMIVDLQKMVDVLHEKQSREFSLTNHIFEGEIHMSVIPALISRGLRSAFA